MEALYLDELKMVVKREIGLDFEEKKFLILKQNQHDSVYILEIFSRQFYRSTLKTNNLDLLQLLISNLKINQL